MVLPALGVSIASVPEIWELRASNATEFNGVLIDAALRASLEGTRKDCLVAVIDIEKYAVKAASSSGEASIYPADTTAYASAKSIAMRESLPTSPPIISGPPAPTGVHQDDDGDAELAREAKCRKVSNLYAKGANDDVKFFTSIFDAARKDLGAENLVGTGECAYEVMRKRRYEGATMGLSVCGIPSPLPADRKAIIVQRVSQYLRTAANFLLSSTDIAGSRVRRSRITRTSCVRRAVVSVLGGS